MTDPQQPPEQSQQDQDEQRLVPALLTVYALYLAWRGANQGFAGNALDVARVLNLRQLVGPALVDVAQRALAAQRQSAGRAGDAFWAHAAGAAQTAAQAGLTVLAEALLWTDSHTQGDPSTSDVGGAQGEATIPTREDPPDLLAQMVVTAVVNVARLAAADLAGWSTKTWQTRQDDRVRDSHVLLQGQTAALDEPFISGIDKLQFPGDPAAPMRQRAGCRCWLRFAR